MKYHKQGAYNSRNALSLRSGCQHCRITVWEGCAPSVDSRGRLSLPLLADGASRYHWAYGHIILISALIVMWPSPVSLCLKSPSAFSYKDLLLDWGPTLIQSHFISRSLPWWYLQRPHLQIRSHSKVPSGHEFGVTSGCPALWKLTHYKETWKVALLESNVHKGLPILFFF